MNMLFPTLNEAKDFFEYVIQERNKSEYPFRDDMEETFRNHCQAVAQIAKTIASKTAYLNSDKAEIMGLLHDCGRIVDEYALHKHHGIVGYHLMNKKGWSELAKISVTHNFPIKDFDIDLMPHPRSDMIYTKKLLSEWEYNDYDKLIQLADALNNLGQTCSIENRYKSISARYKVPYENLLPIINKYNELKQYFDEQCKINIYKLLEIDN